MKIFSQNTAFSKAKSHFWINFRTPADIRNLSYDVWTDARQLVLMGEAPPRALCEKVCEEHLLPDECAFLSIYGSTEASSSMVLDVR